MAIETEKLEASADSHIRSQEETDRSTKKIKTTEQPPQEGTTGGDKSGNLIGLKIEGWKLNRHHDVGRGRRRFR
ncbi:hypothetical protein CCACVL1_02280 [Corchorus capsularis]|uniref:Uncharacterized protein n=1 Tax=Corchorus capsularis TaxID=210143 RepID=A0A1R3K9G5_COCAP|nr:hypothetical protein CCACVL1_02280 [Corchorus capsularis]